jgi:hypothetical protein
MTFHASSPPHVLSIRFKPPSVPTKPNVHSLKIGIPPRLGLPLRKTRASGWIKGLES